MNVTTEIGIDWVKQTNDRKKNEEWIETWMYRNNTKAFLEETRGVWSISELRAARRNQSKVYSSYS